MPLHSMQFISLVIDAYAEEPLVYERWECIRLADSFLEDDRKS